jgi:DNA mismatch repair ATPase MutS
MCSFKRNDLGNEQIVFHYKLMPGPCPKSYGLQVAALAGIPGTICAIAEEVGAAFEARMSRTFMKAGGLAATGACGASSGVGESAAEQGADVCDDEDLALLLPWVQKIWAGDLRSASLSVRRLLPALNII